MFKYKQSEGATIYQSHLILIIRITEFYRGSSNIMGLKKFALSLLSLKFWKRPPERAPRIQ